ncbi:centrosomal protein of 83 kDa-like isoform X1 [Phymastichus coffea]|uniref:centrosomal protein of 83 kDa-like isoform X1 n=1 Tax=Phymastichus coffea TaxID=108790 RepID=UPI00273C2B07|nr:centrosomal protein of 83 kDa-like isoform X1 [Phymastichus coffea]
MKPQYYAKVKYIDDHLRDVKPVNEILEFQSNPHAIKNFDKDAVYSILWKDEKMVKEIEVGIQIADIKMIRSEDELTEFKNKRGVFSILNQSVLNRYYDSDSESDSCKNTPPKLKKTKEVTGKEDKNKERSKQKMICDKEIEKQILQSKLAKFVNTKTLHYDNEKDSDDSNKEKHSEIDNIEEVSIGMRHGKVLNDNLLRKKFEKLEEECSHLKQNQTKLQNTINLLNERLETYRIINERLQIQNLHYDLQIKELTKNEKIHQRSTAAVKEHNAAIGKASTPKKSFYSDYRSGSMSDDDFVRSRELPLPEISPNIDKELEDHSQPETDNDWMEQDMFQDVDVQKTPDSKTKRKLDFEQNWSPSLLQKKKEIRKIF